MMWNSGNTSDLNYLRFTTVGVVFLTSFVISGHGFAKEGVQLSGFMTAGVSHADKKISKLQQLYNIDDKTNFLSDSVVGLQMDYRFDKRSKTSIQLIAQDQNDNYEVDVEWAYLSYLVNPNLTLRAGRLRLPLYNVSETLYVGRSYLWVRPPPEVYSIFTTLSRYNGFDALYDADIGEGIFSVQPFIGQAKDTINTTLGERDVDTDHLAGLVVSYGLDNLRFRFLYSESTFVASPDTPEESKADINFMNFGVDYNLQAFQIKSELANVELDSSITGSNDILGGYITLAYSINKFTPYFTYGINRTDSTQEKIDTDSVTLGIRMDTTNSISTKFDVFHGIAGDLYTYGATGNKELAGIDENVTIVSLVFNLDF